jgi:Flp pilus assembly protein TadB
MEKAQADAIAQAILEPDIRAQEELRNKRVIQSAQHSRKRRVAWLTLVGAGVGAAVAYFSGVHFSIGVILGGLAGSAVGWLITRRAKA